MPSTCPLAEQLLGGAQVETGEGGAGHAVGAPEADGADEGEGRRAVLQDDGDGVAEVEAALVGGGHVEHELVGPPGVRPSRIPNSPVQLVVAPDAGGEGGRASGLDGVAVLVEDQREAGHRPLGHRDTGHVRHEVDDRLVEGSALPWW